MNRDTLAFATSSVVTTAALTDRERRLIITELSRPGSEMQHEIASGGTDDTMIALLYLDDELLAWATVSQWSGHLALQAWTYEDHRRLGLGRACVCMLDAAGALPVIKPVAVFSESCRKLMKQINRTPILFLRGEDGTWTQQP